MIEASKLKAGMTLKHDGKLIRVWKLTTTNQVKEIPSCV